MRKLTPDERANQEHWDRDAEDYQRRHHAMLAGDVRWGPSMPKEADLRILGDVAGKDVLELGCGGGQGIVHVKGLGARRCAGLDLSAGQIAHAREHAEAEKVDVEFVVGSASDLSMFKARSFDVVFSAYALGFVPDLGAAFAEAHRVLRGGGVFAFSWGSPIWQIVEWDTAGAAPRIEVAHSYFDRKDHRDPGDHAGPWTEFRRTYGDYVALLREAGFELTDIVEPKPVGKAQFWPGAYPMKVITKVPATTIWRAVKG